MIVGFLVALVVLAGAAFFLMPGNSTPPPAPTPAPTPVAVATPEVAATPEATPEATQVAAVVEPTPAPPVATPAPPTPTPRAGATPTPTPRSTPTPRPTPTPRATPGPGPTRAAAATPAPTVAAPTSQAPRLIEEARTAMNARDLPRAQQLFDQALRAEPGNADATRGKAEVDARIAAMNKKFSVGATTVIGGKAKSGPTGFDLGGSGVVQTDFSAQIRCTSTPTSLEAGMPYTVRCSILNIGKKAFKIDGVTVNETIDGAKSAGAGVAPRGDIAPQADGVILEKAGTWSAKSQWSLELVAKTSKEESFRAVFNWR